MIGWVTGKLRRAGALITAVLLALCVASPALAEIGCSWDAATHFADALDGQGHGASDAGHADDRAGGDADGSDAPDRDSHCAFSHGHGDLLSGVARPVMLAATMRFARPQAAGFVSSLPPGPDRPPRA